MEIYGLLGIPEEIIHDQGTQFMSDCLAGGLPITPCHPMKNDRVRVLYCYHEVPQLFFGFALFELFMGVKSRVQWGSSGAMDWKEDRDRSKQVTLMCSTYVKSRRDFSTGKRESGMSEPE